MTQSKTLSVALDAGHGKDAPGKRTPVAFGTPVVGEYRVVRQILSEVEWLLNGLQYNVQRTYQLNDISEEKRSQLAMGSTVLVSVHCTDEDCGIHVSYADFSKQSALLGRCIRDGLAGKIPVHIYLHTCEDGLVNRVPRRHIPAVRVEVGALDDLFDVPNLRSDAYKQACAAAIVQGILTYLEL